MTVVGESLDGEDTVAKWQANSWTTAGGLSISSNARWDLYAEAGSWQRVKISATVWLDNVGEFKSRVFPPGSLPDAQFVLQARCARTKWRSLQYAALDSGKVELEINLPSESVYGEVELSPTVVLAKDVPHNTDGFAANMATVVANGFTVSVLTSEPASPPGKGIRRLWQQFPTCGDALYRLSVEETGDEYTPVLYFNSNHPLLKSVVDFRGRKQPNAAARDSLFAMIASDVWMQLVTFAADVTRGGDEDFRETPDAKLAARIFGTLRRKIHKNRSDIISALESDAGRSEVNAAIQHWLKTAIQESGLIAAFHDRASSE